jgi:hypothetical protein
MKLINIISTTSAISPRKGKLAYDYVLDQVASSKPVTISFEGVTECTSSFCNSFIGKLYMTLNPEQLDELLSIVGLEEDSIWLKKIYNAKLLGLNENLRANRKANLNDLILA